MNRYFAYQIGIKWATVKLDMISKEDLAKIKYTNHLDRATVWKSKKDALSWKKKICSKYPIAELVELKLTNV